jgi:cytochrome c-type biogenesis protein CcsB
MSPRFRIRAIDLMVLLPIVGFGVWRGVTRTAPEMAPSTFADQVELGPLHAIAVQADGRLRSFESHAKTYISLVTGGRLSEKQPQGFTMLDLIFRPERYVDADVIYVKNKPARAQIIDKLLGVGAIEQEQATRMQASGLFSPRLLERPEVSSLLEVLSRDLIRTEKVVNQIRLALTVSDARFLMSQMRLVAPRDPETGQPDANQPWHSMAELLDGAGGAPRDATHSGMSGPRIIPGLSATDQIRIRDAWSKLGAAWRAEHAEGVNAQIATLAQVLPEVSAALYPSLSRLNWESWYFRSKSMTWVWLVYLAAVVPLLMSVIYKWDGARRAGMGLFIVAFGAHTASVVLRWYISGRWPNTNMFEAVTTSAWFGALIAMVLEGFARKTALRNLFALGAAVAAMAALMAGYFLPADLDSAISNKMAALHDVWLYIHTNVIIASYALIGLAAVTALVYLRHRHVLAWDAGVIPKWRLVLLPIALVTFNYTAYKIMMHFVNPVGDALLFTRFAGVSALLAGSGMVLLGEMFAARDRARQGFRVERASAGGTASLMAGGAGSFIQKDKATAGQVFDGATMVLMELSFVMLWTGIVMGAIWADHSWGRPWGWDPKEVFALNTFFILIGLIHVRMKVRDKGLWTAIIAVLGFEVMMFNWIVINFIVVGLHSYA